MLISRHKGLKHRDPADTASFSSGVSDSKGVFGVAQEPESPTSAHPGNAAGEEPGEFTRMFEAMREIPDDITPEAQPPKAHAVLDPAASAVQPQDPASATALSDGFTQLFQTARPAVEAAPAVPLQSPAPAHSPAAAEGFTQVFQQIKPTTSAAPDIRTAVPEPVGYTQVFSSLQSARQGAEHTPAAPVSTPPATTPPARDAAAAVKSTSQVFGDKPAEPGAFTQLFQQMNPSVASAASSPAPVLPEPVAASAPASAPPGAFTQMFAAPVRPPAEQRPAQKDAAIPQASASPLGSRQPAPVAAASDGLTEFFRAPASSAPASPSASPSQPFAAAKAPVSEGSFTQVFQALSSQGPSSASSLTPPSTPFGNAPEPRLTPPPAAPSLTGAGDFTRLMNTLEHPPAAATPAASHPESAPLPVFSSAPQSSNASEFTRVMRGPAYRDSAALGAPAVATAPVAPGMVLAPAKAEATPAAAEAPAKSKKMMILVIFNVVLVLALILLAILLLRKH